MLIHVTPEIYLPLDKGNQCRLLDVSVPEMGLLLCDGYELTARRPYPNKGYLVACRRTGRKAMRGILISAEYSPSVFTVTTRWLYRAKEVLTHNVQYRILDNDYDAVSDSMCLWSSCGTWTNRWPEWAAKLSPMQAQPRMSLDSNDGREGDIRNVVSTYGLLLERSEVFPLHTIESERLFDSHSLYGDRMPLPEHAFEASTMASVA